ncbi:protein phosphatase 2C domain-containing protein [Actinokineospora sp. NBRC 105648]|uniref:PP2C family protein-serine/threonine phosphatase n=1 Tax=Actinokineospora sp. NBRC 105648 TaxID=3032206 RepID=UPI0024A3DF79|nr:protein phosphatase 2C domain-containing protein [Actinokineospora sp. NBRC 105648]GLZ41308.1 protein phosphatase [Actinokineospora sp. NBRC 105648]
MTLVLRYAARSDRGLVRSNNQDSVYAGPRLLSLADGMGGHVAGEVASKVVIAALAPLDDDEPGEDLLGQLREATLAGNGAIAELVAGDPDLDGMGTTLSAILFAGNRLGLVHVGDSRVYLRRNGQFSQITHDDTFVQSLIDEGRITEDEAATHPQRSLLLKALTGHEVEPSLTVREARPGDRYLLCSDGLSGPVSHETLSEAIQIPDPQECADRMIELALRGGGPDNVTVIVADVVDVDYGDTHTIVGGAAGNGSDETPPPDSPASRASAMTTPRPEPRKVEQPPPPDPKVKRRKRVRVLIGLALVLVLLAAGAVAARIWVNNQYFVGEGDNGEIAIFQGVRGSVLGLSLNSQLQGSCDPATTTCDRFYVNDLDQFGKDEVRSGSNTFGNIVDAREFVRGLRSRFGLPDCADLAAQQSSTTATATPTTTTATTATTTEQPGTPPGQLDPSAGATTSPTAGLPTATSEIVPTGTAAPTSSQVVPQAGVNCRNPREDKGGG